MMVGVTARSHYVDWYDFEYRGTLFMPFESFRESGAVAKFMVTDKFHMEVAAAVAKAKVSKAIFYHSKIMDFDGFLINCSLSVMI